MLLVYVFQIDISLQTNPEIPYSLPSALQFGAESVKAYEWPRRTALTLLQVSGATAPGFLSLYAHGWPEISCSKGRDSNSQQEGSLAIIPSNYLLILESLKNALLF